MFAAHATSKIEQAFQNWISRELDKGFDIPGIGMIHFSVPNWINIIYCNKKSLTNNVMPESYPGMSPSHTFNAADLSPSRNDELTE